MIKTEIIYTLYNVIYVRVYTQWGRVHQAINNSISGDVRLEGKESVVNSLFTFVLLDLLK